MMVKLRVAMTEVADEKSVMFEIYRDADEPGRFRVVYFTELGEHEREREIAAAFRGDHVFDGYILTRERFEAKKIISALLDRLNDGEPLAQVEIQRRLSPYMA
jgi:hypothetical protein